ncbi:AAA-ATPase At3g50940-like [Durio zibethinus]|uniref:AAA-ATPase At3g50940-like n=1 Tax=Durio zibethinus TaxID=66656 RepID=A0A6P5X7H7_DURZI|nr:AAA-ATPase At3g50940-like [Durio zibethinus]
MDLELKKAVMEDLENFINGEEYYQRVGKAWKRGYLLQVLQGQPIILVVEDIDCFIKLENRESENEHRRNQDGLWSSCGEERIIIFTTNHKERLNPAALRPGRMDMHIHMSYCNSSVFKQLAFNYLGIRDHGAFQQIGRLLEEVNVSPAEVAGELIKSSNVEAAFQGLLKFLHEKISERLAQTKKLIKE